MTAQAKMILLLILCLTFNFPELTNKTIIETVASKTVTVFLFPNLLELILAINITSDLTAKKIRINDTSGFYLIKWCGNNSEISKRVQP